MEKGEAGMKRKHIFLFSLLAIGCTLPFLSYSHAEETIPTPKQIHFVVPGETLDDIADEERPDQNKLRVVYKIEELNGIVDAGNLQVGTELKLP